MAQWGRVFLLVCCGLFAACQAEASGPDPNRPIRQMRHSSWNEAAGVSGAVWALTQTTDGFLWVGTSTGLYRFDGVRFEAAPGLSRDQPILEVRAFLATGDGGLWIGHRNGVAFLREGKAVFYNDQQGLPYGRVRSFARTRDGVIWAAVVGGLARFADGRWSKVETNWNYRASSAEAVTVDPSGTLWVTGGETIQYLPDHEQAFHQTGIEVGDWTGLCTATDGVIWVSDAFNSRLLKIRRTAQGVESHSLKFSRDMNRIHFDQAHSLWIATDSGIFRLPTDTIAAGSGSAASYPGMDRFLYADGLTSPEVDSVFEDREGNIWVGTGNGLDRFSDRSVTQYELGKTPTHLIAGPHSEVWADQENAPFLYPIYGGKPYPLLRYEAQSYYMDRSKTLWAELKAGAEWSKRALWKFSNGKAEKIPYPPGMDRPITKGIIGDARGRLWMTISGYGEYTLKDGTWNQVPVFSGKDHDLAPDAHFIDDAARAWLVFYSRNKVVRVEDGKSIEYTPGHGLDIGSPIVGWSSGSQVWISGTTGIGLLDGDAFRTLHGVGGFAFANVTSIIPTQHDGLWLKAPEGVIQISQAEIAEFLAHHEHAVTYRIFDGGTDFFAQLVRHIPPTSRTDAIQSGDGRLWFITNGGVAMIDPNHLAMNTLAPPVRLRSITADGRTYPVTQGLILPKSTNALSFDYTALSLSFAERNIFRYQLIGFDTEWQNAGTRRQAFYTNLSPGDYTFRVIAANNDGVWNEEGTSLSFTIPPTFLQTIWFRLLVVGAVLLLAWVAYTLRFRQATAEITARLGERLHERERIARHLHDTLLQDFQAVTLRFQIVANRLKREDPNRRSLEEGLDYADKVLAEGRDQIRDIRADSRGQGELAGALSLYGNECAQLRPISFTVAITGFRYDLDPIVCDEIYRIGREAIGNSFKHSGGSRVALEIDYAPDAFRMRVTDDGNGMPDSMLASGRPGHWGLHNIRERARAITATVVFHSKPESGTSLELTIPANLVRRKRLPWLFGKRSFTGE